MKIDGESNVTLHVSRAWHGKLFGWSEKLYGERIHNSYRVRKIVLRKKFFFF